MRIGFTKTVMLSLLAFAVVAFVWPVRTFALTPDTLIMLTNQQRLAAGLQPLHENADLMASAYAKAEDMLTRNYWAHFAPDGTSPWHFISQSGYQYKGAGENLAMDFSDDQAVMDGWMASPTHRANVLNPAYQDVGVAVVDGQLQGHETTLVVAHYGTPAHAVARASAPVTVTPAVALAAAPAPAAASSLPKTVATVQIAHKATGKQTSANTNSGIFTFLKLGLAQMWLTPLMKLTSRFS